MMWLMVLLLNCSYPSMGAVYCIRTTTFQAKTATTLKTKTLHDRIISYVERRVLSPRSLLKWYNLS